MSNFQSITIKANVNVPVEKAWKLWTTPYDITQWNAASDDWHTTSAENDLRPGGKLSARMEAKDGSFGFDFEGIYDEVLPHKKLVFTLGDGRKVEVIFEGNGQQTKITETFDAETENSLELQRGGWQAILDNFKKYAESTS